MDSFFLNQSYMVSFVLNTVIVLFIVLIGGILPLFERKFLSLTQRRVGPKFVGYKGRLQFLADALKVLWKEFLVLYKVNVYYFFILPVFFFNINLIFFVNIYWFSNVSLFDVEYNLIFIIILDIIIHFIIVLVGFFLKNKYTIIASSRLVNITFSIEIFIILIDSFIIFLANSFSFQNMFIVKDSLTTFYFLIPVVPLFLIYFLIETAKTPFDIVEAETEIIMGYHVEYSGFLFGLFVLSEYFHVLVSVYLLSVVVF